MTSVQCMLIKMLSQISHFFQMSASPNSGVATTLSKINYFRCELNCKFLNWTYLVFSVTPQPIFLQKIFTYVYSKSCSSEYCLSSIFSKVLLNYSRLNHINKRNSFSHYVKNPPETDWNLLQREIKCSYNLVTKRFLRFLDITHKIDNLTVFISSAREVSSALSLQVK